MEDLNNLVLTERQVSFLKYVVHVVDVAQELERQIKHCENEWVLDLLKRELSIKKTFIESEAPEKLMMLIIEEFGDSIRGL